MSNNVEQIKQRLSIVDVVQSYLELTKAGANFRARCPFHNERTPSFFVSAERDSFYCFGCNKGGDIFTFVQEIEGLEFKEALSQLAERAGVELVFEGAQKEQKGEKERLRELMASAVFFYHKALSQNQNVIEYLKKRGVTTDTIKQFRIGYSRPEWRELIDFLKERGFTEQEIVIAGLAIHNREAGRHYDRFRNRIMFPIADINGAPIAFSGRIYDELPGADTTQGKYINNPQTPLYDKSRALFAYDKAKQAIRISNVCVLVEGQMDVVMSHQVQVTNAVAVSGTAFTENHVRTIGRIANTIVMAFDGDDAGIRATERAAQMALGEGITVRIAQLPKGEDPADVARRSTQEWKNAVDNAKHVIDFLTDALLNGATDVRAKRMLAKERILPYIARLTSSIEQAHFVSKLATVLGIGEEPIWSDIRSLMGSTEQPTRLQKNEPAIVVRSRKESIVRHIIGLRHLLNTTAHDSLLAELLGGDVWESLLRGHEVNKEALIFEQERAYDENEREKELQNLVQELRIELIRTELHTTLAQLKEKERLGTAEEVAILLKQTQDISNTLNTLKQQRPH
ncbi:MAG: DNA primase [bacterium]|nr:DNA primase [bacterium]